MESLVIKGHLVKIKLLNLYDLKERKVQKDHVANTATSLII